MSESKPAGKPSTSTLFMKGISVTEQQLKELTSALTHLASQNLIQGLAIQAMARHHPAPKEVAVSFRHTVENFLAQQDDGPLPSSANDAALLEINAFLEAIERAGRAGG